MADPTVDGALSLAATCSCVRVLARAERGAREDDADRRTPQERAIEGPAVYPINAPATAPTGPRTTAPDTAPSAASPARSWALASNGKNEPAISAPTSSFFIAVSLRPAGRTALRNCGGTKVRILTVSLDSGSSPIQKAGGQFPGAGSKILAMMNMCR